VQQDGGCEGGALHARVRCLSGGLRASADMRLAVVAAPVDERCKALLGQATAGV
jgi:hypothetical protein